MITIPLALGIGTFGIWATSRLAGDAGWVLALAANTSYLAMYPLLGLAGVALLLRRPMATTLAVVFAVFALLPVAPSLHPARWAPGLSEAGSAAPDDPEGPYRLLVLNIRDNAGAVERLGRLVAREKPDFLALIECSPELIPRVLAHPDISARLPFSSSELARERWPLLTMSRFPMHRATFSSGAPGYEWIFAYHRSQLVDTPQGRLLFTATHVTSPTTAESWRQGNRGLELLVRCIHNDLAPTGVPLLIAGDFNCTRAGFRYEWFEANSGLHAADDAGSLTGSWPSGLPGFLRIGLDQAWASPHVRWVGRRVLEDVGSDHHPVLFSFELVTSAATPSPSG